MNVVDSSGWLEFFADGPNAGFFARAVEHTYELVVPSISLYEVFKHIVQQRGEDAALRAIEPMLRGQVVDLDRSLSLHAASLSIALRLPMADSIILATAQAHEAHLWTQDQHFKGLPHVRYVERRASH